MKERIGIVQIGTGGIGNHHLRLWRDIPHVDLVGVYDIAPEAAQRTAERWGVPRVYETLEAALADEQAHAVMVATPTGTHAAVTIAALRAGKHVLCEKPLAVTAGEIEEMIAARDASGKMLTTIQHMRFEPKTRALMNLIEHGRIGEVYYAKATWLRRRAVPPTPGFITRELSGRGPGADLGVHVIDLAWYLMGRPRPVAVSGTSVCKLANTPGRYNGWGQYDPTLYDVEDFAAGWVRFENGAALLVEVSWMLNILERERTAVQICGDAGGAAWPDLKWVWEADGLLHESSLDIGDNHPSGHAVEMQAFCDAIRTGGPSPVPPEESLIVGRVLDALYASAEAGHEVRL